MGCSVRQGYLFAAPLDELQFPKLLNERLMLGAGRDAGPLLTMLDGNGV